MSPNELESHLTNMTRHEELLWLVHVRQIERTHNLRLLNETMDGQLKMNLSELKPEIRLLLSPQ